MILSMMIVDVMEMGVKWKLVDLEVSKGDLDLWDLGEKERVCGRKYSLPRPILPCPPSPASSNTKKVIGMTDC
jgi:hypothetical protein